MRYDNDGALWEHKTFSRLLWAKIGHLRIGNGKLSELEGGELIDAAKLLFQDCIERNLKYECFPNEEIREKWRVLYDRSDFDWKNFKKFNEYISGFNSNH